MMILFLLIVLLLCLYCGQVLGLMVHCDNCDDFKEIKRYVWIVPFMKLALLWPCLRECLQEKSLKSLRFYLFSGNMSMVILCAMIDAFPGWKETLRNKKIKKLEKRINMQKSLVPETLKSILSDVETALGYDLNYM